MIEVLEDLTVRGIRKQMLLRNYPQHFVDQLEREPKLHTDYGQVQFADIHPLEETQPDPVMCVGGFSQGRHTYVDEMYDFYQAGYRVVYANPLRGLGYSVLPHSVRLALPEELPAVVCNKMTELYAMLSHLEIESVHTFGHSQGGMVLAALAATVPELVKTLVMVTPEGFQDDSVTADIMMQFFYQAADQTLEVTGQALQGNTAILTRSGWASRSFLKQIGREPYWRATQEIPEGLKVSVPQLLTRVKDGSVRSVLVTAYSDRLFTPEMYERTLVCPKTGELDPLQYVDTWMSYKRKAAGHTAIGLEEPGLMRQIIESTT